MGASALMDFSGPNRHLGEQQPARKTTSDISHIGELSNAEVRLMSAKRAKADISDQLLFGIWLQYVFVNQPSNAGNFIHAASYRRMDLRHDQADLTRLDINPESSALIPSADEQTGLLIW